MAAHRLEPLLESERHPAASEASKQKLLLHLKSIETPGDVKWCSKEEYPLVREREKCYPTKHSPRGRALVVTMTANREGWEADVIALHEMFLYLDIKSRYLFDLTGKNLVTALEKFASNEKSEKVDCLFVVLMGHGGQITRIGENKNKEFLLTSDNFGFLVQDGIKSIFNSQKYSHLLNKPKVFLVQMCRGDAESQGVDIYQSSSSMEADASDALAVRPVAKSSTFSDYIIGFASQPGTKSFRHKNHGARYIQQVCRVFRQNAAEKQVEDMLKEVNRTLEELAAEPGEAHVQAGEYISAAKRPLYLFPVKKEFRPVEQKVPKLECKAEWNTDQHGAVEKLLAFKNSQDDCLIACRGRAELCLGYRSNIRQYLAKFEEEEVWDICVYEQYLFLIQSDSVTVYNLNSQRPKYEIAYSLPASTYNVTNSNRKNKFQFNQDEEGWDLRGGVALTSDTLALIDGKAGQVIVHKLGESTVKVVLSGISIPASLCKDGEAEQRRFFLTETEEHRVRVYDHTWRALSTIGSFGGADNTIGSFGGADGQFRFPMDAAVTEDGTILVADAGNWRVSEFSPYGEFLRHRLTRKYLREGRPHRLSVMGEIIWINVVDKQKQGEVILKFRLPAN